MAFAHALKSLNLPAYLEKTSSLGHQFIDAAPASEVGRAALASGLFRAEKFACSKRFDRRGYFEHLVLA